MSKYQHLFFDLDHTLWDLEKNSAETLHEIFERHALSSLGISSAENFIKKYLQINEVMWEQFRLGKIDKQTLRTGRFLQTLEAFGLMEENKLAAILADDYIASSPEKTNLFPYAHESLTYLQANYTLHIITNGFPEVQKKKLSASGIAKYFSKVFISEEVGFKKPEKEIFEFALKNTGAKKSESIMIGDNMEIDVFGARMFGMDQIWFNPTSLHHEGEATFKISSLHQLQQIF